MANWCAVKAPPLTDSKDLETDLRFYFSNLVWRHSNTLLLKSRKALEAYSCIKKSVKLHFSFITHSVNNITLTQGLWPFVSVHASPSSPLQPWHHSSLKIKSQIWCQFYCQFILPVCAWNINTCGGKFLLLKHSGPSWCWKSLMGRRV